MIFKNKKDLKITQKNLAENREEIIARGKKFRYPFQYAKHRLVINTILIGAVVVVTAFIVGWAEFYEFQSTSDVFYRVSKVAGNSVAKVDDVNVRYSDYLMLYRSSISSVEYQQGAFDDSEDSERQKAQYRREALNLAEEYALAMAKLEELGIEVSDKEIDDLVLSHKSIDGVQRSDEAFEGIVMDNFGLTVKEYRRLLSLSLAKKKASEAIDKEAKSLAAKLTSELTKGASFEDLYKQYAETNLVSLEVTDNVVETTNLDGGRAAMAASLQEVGDFSKAFVSKNGDGYYIVKLTNREDGRVSYESLSVRFTALEKEMEKLRDEGKIREFITLE